jgi:hypothetical protein
MILGKKKTKITEEDVRAKGQLKDYPEKILTVKTDRTTMGFTQEDITEVNRTIMAMTKELNDKIVSMFKLQSENKMTSLRGKMENNGANFQERNDVFAHELQEMNNRFDYLKRAEQRTQDIMDYAIVYKEQKRSRRLCFDILKHYAHTQRNVRAVVASNSSEWKNI